jgi:hypothetical protein
MPFKIRRMTRADRPAIIEILRNTPAFIPEEVDTAGELIDCYLEDPSGCGYHFYVAEHAGGIYLLRPDASHQGDMGCLLAGYHL